MTVPLSTVSFQCLSVCSQTVANKRMWWRLMVRGRALILICDKPLAPRCVLLGKAPELFSFFFFFWFVTATETSMNVGFKLFISDLQLVSDTLGDRDTRVSPASHSSQPSSRRNLPLFLQALKQDPCSPVKHTWRITSLSALCGDSSLSWSWSAASFLWPEEWPPQEWPQEQHFPATCTASPYRGLLFSPHEWSLNSLRHSREGANRLFP